MGNSVVAWVGGCRGFLGDAVVERGLVCVLFSKKMRQKRLIRLSTRSRTKGCRFAAALRSD